MKPTLGSQPIEPRYQEQMKRVARFIYRIFNRGEKHPDRRTGWVLMVYPFGIVQGRCNYISNSRREDVICMLKEQLPYFEGRAMEDAQGRG